MNLTNYELIELRSRLSRQNGLSIRGRQNGSSQIVVGKTTVVKTAVVELTFSHDSTIM